MVLDKFDRSLAFTLRWEGGYANHPNDPGGATMMGVTQRVYNRWRDGRLLPRRPVREIERHELELIYGVQYWKASGADQLEWPLCLVVFDAAVNHGVARARQWLTRALDIVNEVKPDGPEVLEASRVVIDLRVNFYYRLARTRPTMRVFLKGWLNRARALKQLVGY